MQSKIRIINTLLLVFIFSISKAQTTTEIISAPIVKKAFVKKNGKGTEYKEHYIQRSITDYFIKFCESDITSKELDEHLHKIDSEIKYLTLEVEFKEGSWDICDDNEFQQSRIGEYVVIHRIIEN